MNNTIFSNPFIKKRILRLPDGSSISADKYIEEYVLPRIGDTDTIVLKKGKKVPFNQFINKYVFGVCQRDYNGDFDKFYDDYVVDNVNDFLKKNGIDVQKISEMPESNVYNIHDYYSIISKYIIYNDPIFTKKSIADIVGVMSEPYNYDKKNIANNLRLYFSQYTEKIKSYTNRADTMLDYSSENIVSGLYESFNKEPMVITELENGKALISENGMHRYHLLRLHYLNELRRVSSEAEAAKLREKYTIPVKMETIDLFKTYSNFLLGLSGLQIYLSKTRDKNLHQTDKTTLYFNGKKYLVSDAEIIAFLRTNLDKLKDKKDTIDKLCEYIPSFKEYISSYLPELLKDNKKAFSI